MTLVRIGVTAHLAGRAMFARMIEMSVVSPFALRTVAARTHPDRTIVIVVRVGPVRIVIKASIFLVQVITETLR